MNVRDIPTVYLYDRTKNNLISSPTVQARTHGLHLLTQLKISKRIRNTRAFREQLTIRYVKFEASEFYDHQSNIRRSSREHRAYNDFQGY